MARGRRHARGYCLRALGGLAGSPGAAGVVVSWTRRRHGELPARPPSRRLARGDRRLRPGPAERRGVARLAGGEGPGQRSRSQARRRRACLAARPVQGRRQPHLRDRVLEWGGLHLPVVGGASGGVCGVRAGGGKNASVGAAEAAQAAVSRRWHAGPADSVYRSASGVRDRHPRERRRRQEILVRQRLHDLRRRRASTGHDVDPPGRPYLSEQHVRTYRAVLPRALTW